MELSGFEPLTSWVLWNPWHPCGSGQNLWEGAWLLTFGALRDTLIGRRAKVGFESFGRGLEGDAALRAAGSSVGVRLTVAKATLAA